MKLGKIKYIFLMTLMIAIGIQGIYILSATLTLSTLQKIILISIQVISVIGLIYFHIIDNKENKEYWIHLAHVIIFMIYLANLGYILMFDPDFGRNVQDMMGFDLVNLEFMRTIRLFINGYQLGILSLESVLTNIVGNLLIFMPMAYFLPYFFKKQRKWYIFFMTIALIVFGVEVMQMLLRTGSGDIDDWFLNVTGALFLYGVLKIVSIDKLYNDRKE